MIPIYSVARRSRRAFRAGAVALGIASATGFAGVAAPAAAQAPRGHADGQAEGFVQGGANRVLSVLNDGSMSLDAKKRQFRQVIDQVADVPRITSFVLGKYRRSFSPEQYRQFSEVFREYANNIYESRLNQYRGQRLTVTGSVARSPTDVIVVSQIAGAGGGRGSPVSWRVIRGADGGWRVVDVQVSGVWLAITEQQDFVSTLDNAGGDVNVLIRQLRSQAGRPAA